MAELELIGVPFDGFGRPGNQTRAAATLREAGFVAAFDRHTIARSTELELPPPDTHRANGSGLVNERALITMTDSLNSVVADALRLRRFPVVYGGDCSSLLGSVTGLKDAVGSAALLFIDGHEDTMPLDTSEDGEAANTEIGLLLGLTGHLAPTELAARLPALRDESLAMLGQRDEAWRLQFNVGSLRDLGVWLRTVDEVASAPSQRAIEAVLHLLGSSVDWWLHVDLDVLDPLEFAAQGLPGVADEPGGLSWRQLTELTTAAIAMSGCRGLSLAIYDPDQDPNGVDAARIVQFARDVAAALPQRLPSRND